MLTSMTGDVVGQRSHEKEKLFGYEIPMPRSDLFIALATVVSFLPVFVIVYRTVAWLYSSVTVKKRL